MSWRARLRLLFPSVVLVAGCGGDDPTEPTFEILPGMVDSVPYDAFATNPNTPDHKTLLSPPKGSIPRGALPLPYGPGPAEAIRAGEELVNPLEATPANLVRGEVLFGRFCSPCHGTEGLGDGPVVPMFPAPPSLVAAHARGLKDGQIVHVISRGQGLMQSYGAQVQLADRWKIVHFVRSLQAKSGGSK